MVQKENIEAVKYPSWNGRKADNWEERIIIIYSFYFWSNISGVILPNPKIRSELKLINQTTCSRNRKEPSRPNNYWITDIKVRQRTCELHKLRYETFKLTHTHYNFYTHTIYNNIKPTQSHSNNISKHTLAQVSSSTLSPASSSSTGLRSLARPAIACPILGRLLFLRCLRANTSYN